MQTVSHEVFRPFGSEHARIMSLAFDTAWRELLVTGSPLAASFNAEATREALALRIVRMARHGNHDLSRLRDDALNYVQRDPSLARGLASAK